MRIFPKKQAKVKIKKNSCRSLGCLVVVRHECVVYGARGRGDGVEVHREKSTRDATLNRSQGKKKKNSTVVNVLLSN